MELFDFSYSASFLHPETINDYFNNSSLEISGSKDLPCNLFVRFFSGDLPESFERVLSGFPGLCFFERETPLRHRFVLAAEQGRFHEVVQFSKELECKVFWEEIRQEFGFKPEPCFEVGGTGFSGERPVVMGILNVTPDSFYDGGLYYQKKSYEAIARKMILEGAEIIDIGGESTRPGSKPVEPEEELRRILPPLREIKKKFGVLLSVDTTKPEVAREALKNGADMINDVSGLSGGERMIEVIREFKASYCLMHVRGTPEKMQLDPEYFDVVSQVYCFFKRKLERLSKGGIPPERILLDPGIGFGKNLGHNMDLQRFLRVYKNLGSSLLIGTSNKSFIGMALGRESSERLAGSLASYCFGWSRGARFFRVHQIKEAKDALEMSCRFTHPAAFEKG
ncbi:MAG: dihydropteroate synthase [Deltaproteobacteria bacterium]|nr:dihydropteroate synthase [Deltaproteobacteria bacterium]